MLTGILVSIVTVAGALASEPGVHLQRATLTVSDLEKSLAFYRDGLGFRVRTRSPYDTPALRRMFAIPNDAQPELLILDAHAEQSRALALIHAPGMTADAASNRVNAPALVFSTAQLDQLHARLEQSGVEVLLPPTVLHDFSGKPYGRESAYLDPDGVRVILFEYD